MKDTTRNTIVGLTTLGGLVLLGYLILIFGEMPRWGEKTYSLQIHMKNSAGISTGTRVNLNGIDIGQVQRVQLKQPTFEGVIVFCDIQQDYPIPTNCTVLSSAGLIGGGAILNINSVPPPAGQEETFLPTDGTAIIIGESGGITDRITQLADELRRNLQQPLAKFTEMADNIASLAKQYEQLGKNLTEMTDARSLADVDAGTAEANIRTLVARTDTGLKELQKAIDSINQLVGEEMQEKLRKTLDGATEFTENANTLTADVQEKLQVLTERVVAVTDELSITLQSTNALLLQAKDGDGTVGRLMKDPAMYEAFTDAANRLTDTLREAQLLIQKWKAEGLPIKL